MFQDPVILSKHPREDVVRKAGFLEQNTVETIGTSHRDAAGPGMLQATAYESAVKVYLDVVVTANGIAGSSLNPVDRGFIKAALKQTVVYNTPDKTVSPRPDET
jgi:hypothetical protein